MKTATLHTSCDAQVRDEGGELLGSDQPSADAQLSSVAALNIAPTSQSNIETQTGVAGWGDNLSELRTWARMLDDTEQLRMACDQRIAADKKRGLLPDLHMQASRDDLKHAEDRFAKLVKQFYRSTPVYAFTRTIPGMGDKIMGRLIAEIGDPYIATPHHWDDDERKHVASEPYARTVSQLLAYCGVGDPTRKRKIAMPKEDAAKLGKPRPKAILVGPKGIADQIVCHRPQPYRGIYDQRKARYAAEHPDWPKMKVEKYARKVAVKRFLLDLWAYSRDAA